MPPIAPRPAPRPAPTASADASYRMLWRWHFYAGLFVMPFLIVLAVTGTLYCFQPQIEPLLYPHLLKVEPSGDRLPPQRLLDRARVVAPASRPTASWKRKGAEDPRSKPLCDFLEFIIEAQRKPFVDGFVAQSKSSL